MYILVSEGANYNGICKAVETGLTNAKEVLAAMEKNASVLALDCSGPYTHKLYKQIEVKYSFDLLIEE